LEVGLGGGIKMESENKNCCCQFCREEEIERLRKDIKSDIKLLKSSLNLGFFDLDLFNMPNVAETRAKLIYEKVKRLRELEEMEV
jgi:hypothetical protein